MYRFKGKKGKRSTLSRTLAITTVYLIVLIGLVGLFFIIIPELSSSISAFVQNLPGYLRDLDGAFRGFIATFHLEKYVGDMDSLYAMIDSAMEYVKTIAPDIANIGFKGHHGGAFRHQRRAVGVCGGGILALLQGKFIAQIKKATFALFPKKFAGSIVLLSRETNDIFGGYISGKLMQSFCLFALNFIAMAIMRLPYAALISAIMGITDIIPSSARSLAAFLCHPAVFGGPEVCAHLPHPHNHHPTDRRADHRAQNFGRIHRAYGLLGCLRHHPGRRVIRPAGHDSGHPLFAVLYSVIRQYMNNRLEHQGLSTDSKDYHSPSI